MNNDLVSREALKKAFEDTVCIEPMPYAFVKQIIDNAPTVLHDNYAMGYQDGVKKVLSERPQGDLISREALKKALWWVEDNPYIDLDREIMEEIDNAPTVEINTNDIEYKAYCKGLEDGKKIARPKGEWVENLMHSTICSNCGGIRRDNRVDYIAFCNKCGAKMKGGAE